MSYADIEVSAEDGRPTRLYVFIMDRGEGLDPVTWRYTSASKDVLVGLNLYKAVAITDSGIRQTGESNTDAMTITAPITIGPAAMYMSGPVPSKILIRILNKHEGDAETRAAYVGEVSQVNFPAVGKALITCETLSASMNRDGLRLGWQKSCPYALYDPLTCKVNKASFATTATVTDLIDALTVQTSFTGVGFPVDWFAGGIMEWVHSVRGRQSRTIESQVVGKMNMFGPCDDLVVGQTVMMYPGCARTRNICNGRFFNLANYGGFPHMPGKSPFDGDPIF